VSRVFVPVIAERETGPYASHTKCARSMFDAMSEFVTGRFALPMRFPPKVLRRR
jgi:hypothetical protein